jgi:hypothetical protein
LWLAVLAAVSVLAALAIVWGPMRRVLSANSTLALARGFYTRCLVLILLFSALAGIAAVHMPSADEQKSWATMQYVWWVANGLESVFWALAIFLLGYAIVLAILYSVLGRHRDQ